MDDKLADKLPYWHFDGDLMVYHDGSLGCGFVLQGKDISSGDASLINGFNQSLKNLILSMKEGYKLQIFYRNTSNAKDMIGHHEKLMGNSRDRYKLVKDARIRFFRENQKEGNYFVPEVYFFVRSSPYAYKKQGLFGNLEKFQKMTLEKYEKHKNDFQKEQKKIFNSLDLCGLNPKVMAKEAWFKILFEYFNLSRSEKIGTPRLKDSNCLFEESLAEQICLTDVGISKDFLKIGDYYFKFVSLSTLPEGFTYAAMVADFLRLPFHFWVCQSIVIHSQVKEIEKLKIQRRLANSFAQGAKEISDIESESKLGQIEELLGELIEGSDRIVSNGFNVIVWDRKREEVEEKADAVLVAFREMNQAEGTKEDYGEAEMFLGIIWNHAL